MQVLSTMVISLFLLLSLVNHAQADEQIDEHVVVYQGDLLLVDQQEYPRRSEVMLLEYQGGVRVCQTGGEKYYAGVLLIRVKPGTTAEQFASLASRYGLAGRPVGDFARYTYVVDVPDKFERQWAEVLSREPRILSARPEIMNFLADPGPPLKVE